MPSFIEFIFLYIGIAVVVITAIIFVIWMYCSITGYFKELLNTLKGIHTTLQEYIYLDDSEDGEDEDDEEGDEEEE